ncbi:UPF0182 family protein [Nocardia seriolae]|uniref:UPF0182 protein NS506_02199 n=1 Tax=Nocardia seriolae TaxID=37332 RepID=A0ABC9Z6B4_9NOCA|nr:UPF0182 family protein [Nocardia seriolae]APA96266.1 UPF0182 protein [Nocardia seriolae]OJF82414.1 membrane protein [Nocardia seriolae]QOW33160.1 UPF0182 family protein [Nocardia seriolae]QUN21091.1 UPF0182 family protein [Nocardia seriolae]WKY53899.1 UPF0182 family protein [Nocardia seriolae]
MGMRPPTGLPSLSRRSRILLVTALVLAALLLVGPRLTDAYTNWLWFGEVGFRNVFTTVLVTRILLFLVVAIVVALIIWAALLLAYRSRPVFVPVSGPGDPIARYRTTVMSRLKLFGIGIPVLIGVLSGLVAQSNWVTVQLFLHGGSFGVKDPQFHLDVGFYAFDLPFYRMVLNWLFVAVVIAFFANLVAHYVFGGLRLSGREGALSTSARVQLAILAGIFVLLKAIAYWFDRYALLSSTRKEPTFTGGSYTDINAVLPAKLILLSIAVICAIAFFAGVVLRDLRIPAMAAALLVLSSVLVGAVWPLLVEQFSVKPNASTKERAYIERNIAATREAYGLTPDKVEYTDYKGVASSDQINSATDQQTIKNIRLLDPNLLTQTFIQRNQQLQNFYGFPDPLDIDRYTLPNGEKSDFIVAARELQPQNLSENQTNWLNKHTVYTHGNGFVAAPANKVNAAPPKESSAAGQSVGSDSGGGYGYPVFTVPGPNGDLSTVSDLFTPKDKQAIPVDEPRIYYGELISKSDADYAIVGANGSAPREYDKPDAQYTYNGTGGVKIGNWFNRMAFAAKYAERNILFSGAIGPDSKIIFNRNPRDRVTQVAPWLTADGDVYPAVVKGRIVWIVDGYTTLDNYPYAQRTPLDGAVEDSIDQTTGRLLPRKEVSYIRNSVKATVDAYDGTVSLYEVDKTDPVLKAWEGVFPGTVKPESAISDELRAHFRYPEDLFKVQREMLAKYHVDDPVEFFNGNAFWSVPNDPTQEGAASTAHQPPYYVLLGDPKAPQQPPQFSLTSVMVGYKRQFMSAYIQAHSDPGNYGKLTVLKLPADSQTSGPGQTQTALTQADQVARDRNLLTGGGVNKIKYGNLLTLPVGDGGILYVEPWYLERNTGGPGAPSFPQLVKVLASYKDKVGYGATVKEALDQILPTASGSATDQPGQTVTPPTQGATPPTTPVTPPTGSTGKDAAVKQLDDALKAVQDAQKSGDLGQLGKALEQLQAAVNNYQKAGG